MRATRKIAVMALSIASAYGSLALGADEKPKVRNGPKFTVLAGPLEFVSLTPLKRADGQRGQKGASLEAMDTVTLAGKEGKKPLSLNKRDVLYVGDTIESGTIISAGGMSILLDSNDKKVVLQSGEGAVVVEQLLGMSCENCAKLAKETCPGGVQSVTCGADGSRSFSCFEAM